MRKKAMTSTKQIARVPYSLNRVSTLMEPDGRNPLEAEGVLNPATGWNPAGDLVLFPRLVSAGNFSRIGRAKVEITNGIPMGVTRDGIALEPERSWEHGKSHGGTEDPRITKIESLGLHVMTYVAFGPTGPRTALAISSDLSEWRRLGPVLFDYVDDIGVDLNLYPNKDVVFFPEVVPGPDGVPSYAALHRPMWELSFSRPQEVPAVPSAAPDARPAIWISFISAAEVHRDVRNLVRFGSHQFVAGSEYPWEDLKVGAGPAPIRINEGWLVLHHGASGNISGGSFKPQSDVRYCAGAMILDSSDPSSVLARTSEPLLEPETTGETDGTVANVVFPTAVERIEGVDYVFYGMADSRIGVARLDRIPG